MGLSSVILFPWYSEKVDNIYNDSNLSKEDKHDLLLTIYSSLVNSCSWSLNCFATGYLNDLLEELNE